MRTPSYIAWRIWRFQSTSIEREKESNKEAHTHTHIYIYGQRMERTRGAGKHKHTQTVTILLMPPGKLLRLWSKSATNAWTHTQRVWARFPDKRNYNSVAGSTKEAKSSGTLETNVFDITGPPRTENDNLNMPFSCRARDETNNAQQTAQATGIEPRTARFASCL